MGGLHTLGFKGPEMRGKHTRWTMNPYVFDNHYFKNILTEGGSRYWTSELDQRLLEDPEAREWCETFAQDQDRFFEEYAKGHVMVSEFNCDSLMNEVGINIEDGGYVEKSKWRRFANWLNGDEVTREQIEREMLTERIQQPFPAGMTNLLEMGQEHTNEPADETDLEIVDEQQPRRI